MSVTAEKHGGSPRLPGCQDHRGSVHLAQPAPLAEAWAGGPHGWLLGFPSPWPHAAALFVRNHEEPTSASSFLWGLSESRLRSVFRGGRGCGLQPHSLRFEDVQPGAGHFQSPGRCRKCGPHMLTSPNCPLCNAVPSHKSGRQSLAGMVLQNRLPRGDIPGLLPIAAVPGNHKFSGWKRHRLLHVQSWRPEVLCPTQWAETTWNLLPGSGGCSPRPSSPCCRLIPTPPLPSHPSHSHPSPRPRQSQAISQHKAFNSITATVSLCHDR